MKSYGESWADAWVGNAPNLIFEIYFMLYHSIWPSNEGYDMSPQISDNWGHHCLVYPMIDKMSFGNYDRNENFRGLSGVILD